MHQAIQLTKYTPADFPAYIALVSDAEVMQYITAQALSISEAEIKFREILRINQQESQFGYFKVFNAHHALLGECKLEKYKRDPRMLEIGYILKKDYWGQGYGSLICDELLRMANDYAPESALIGIIDPANIASRKLLSSRGFSSFFIGVEDGLATEKLILKRDLL